MTATSRQLAPEQAPELARDRAFTAARASLAVLILLAVWSLIPAGLWWAGASPDIYSGAWATWGWGSMVVGLLVALAAILTRGRALALGQLLEQRLVSIPTRFYVAGVAVIAAVFAIAICLGVFAGNPVSVDGFAQLFEARLLLSGHTWAKAPQPLANFGTLQMILGPDRWYSQYPPGQAAVLAGGLVAGAWWLLNPLLVALLIAATYRLARWCSDEGSARLAILLAIISPFFLAMAGSEMNHLGAATLGVGAAALATYAKPGRWIPAAIAGVALGLMTAFRPLDAVAAAVPVAVILLATAIPRVMGLLAVAAGGVIGTVPTLAFNAATTGSWRTFGYNALWGRGVSLGFHPVPWGIPLTPLRAVGLTGLDLHQLNTYSFDMPLPLIAVVALGFAAGWRRIGRRDAVPIVAVSALSGLLFFYWHRDVLYGPRFLFSAFPWYLILAGRALTLLSRNEKTRIASLAVLVALVMGLLTIAPARLRAYRNGNPAFAFHPDRDAQREGISHAVAVIPDGWGTRLIARMWEAGISVPRSGQLYGLIDACTLELALDRAEQDGGEVSKGLESLAALAQPGVIAGVTDDPNLRLVPGREVAPRCADQINFDRKYGVLAFAPFLYLNTPALDGDVVWARDLGDHNAALFARYPGRRFYRYAPLADGGPAVFTPLY